MMNVIGFTLIVPIKGIVSHPAKNGGNAPQKRGLGRACMGQDSVSSPRGRLRCRSIRRSKDWSCTEFLFSSFSHKLSMEQDKKGEFHERNRTRSPFTDPNRHPGQPVDHPRRMDSSSGSKLLVPSVRRYGNNYIFSSHPCRLAFAIGNPNCWNSHTHLPPAQPRCTVASRGATAANARAKS